MVILDSLSTLVRSGVENEAESWQPIQDWLMKHRWQGRTMVLVHHENKSGKQRGSSKREDVLDTMIGLKKRFEESTDDETVFELTFTKSRDFYGADAEPLLLHFAIEHGQVVWRHEAKRDVRRERVLEMLDAGMKQKEIAQELGLTAGRVSQLVKEIKREENVVPFNRSQRRDDEV
jgi:putative DNA primase/helicase